MHVGELDREKHLVLSCCQAREFVSGGQSCVPNPSRVRTYSPAEPQHSTLHTPAPLVYRKRFRVLRSWPIASIPANLRVPPFLNPTWTRPLLVLKPTCASWRTWFRRCATRRRRFGRAAGQKPLRTSTAKAD